ncbi:MAG: putative peroxiredoxin [Chlamydiales bacterium]|jgi:predicted peroxiredoxin
MSRKVLSVIDTAYRACQEEQDDAGLWFSAAVNNAGVDMTILLTGNAVNYAVQGHATSPLSVGGGVVAHPFDPGQDIERLTGKGISFFLIREDAEERGIDSDELINAVEAIPRSQLAKLVDSHDAIWHW